MDHKSSIKNIFDAMTGESPDCPSDWCAEVMRRADPADVQRVREAIYGHPEHEAAFELGVVD